MSTRNVRIAQIDELTMATQKVLGLVEMLYQAAVSDSLGELTQREACGFCCIMKDAATQADAIALSIAVRKQEGDEA